MVMSQIHLNLVDYTFHRKIKPIQNFSLIATGLLWGIILPLLFLQNQALARIAAYLMIVSIIPLSFFLILSIPFLFKKRTGKVILEDDKLKIGEKLYSLNRVEFKVNIDQSEWTDSSKSIEEKLKRLPKWGNYILLDTNNKFEFEPIQNISKLLDSITINGYEKRPALLVKTTDLFNNIMSMLWAAS